MLVGWFVTSWLMERFSGGFGVFGFFVVVVFLLVVWWAGFPGYV